MGRKKPGKSRRTRQARRDRYTLQELQPPGALYEEWYCVAPEDVGRAATAEPGLDEDALDLLTRILRLAPLYDHEVPQAALHLDNLVDTGKLAVWKSEDRATLTALENIPGLADAGLDEIRESMHKLHSIGALLVHYDEEHDLALVRFVRKRPERPGEPWLFVGDDDQAAVASTCIPNQVWTDLPLKVGTAVAYLRNCQSQLEEPDLHHFAENHGIEDIEEAKQLLAEAEASGYVALKGCEACPAGHLCTRDQSV